MYIIGNLINRKDLTRDRAKVLYNILLVLKQGDISNQILSYIRDENNCKECSVLFKEPSKFLEITNKLKEELPEKEPIYMRDFFVYILPYFLSLWEELNVSQLVKNFIEELKHVKIVIKLLTRIKKEVEEMTQKDLKNLVNDFTNQLENKFKDISEEATREYNNSVLDLEYNFDRLSIEIKKNDNNERESDKSSSSYIRRIFSILINTNNLGYFIAKNIYKVIDVLRKESIFETILSYLRDENNYKNLFVLFKFKQYLIKQNEDVIKKISDSRNTKNVYLTLLNYFRNLWYELNIPQQIKKFIEEKESVKLFIGVIKIIETELEQSSVEEVKECEKDVLKMFKKKRKNFSREDKQNTDRKKKMKNIKVNDS